MKIETDVYDIDMVKVDGEQFLRFTERESDTSFCISQDTLEAAAFLLTTEMRRHSTFAVL